MKRLLPWTTLLVTAGLLTACGEDEPSATADEPPAQQDNQDNSEQDEAGQTAGSEQGLAQEGPLSFEVPEGWQQEPVEGELPEHAWTVGYADSLEDATSYLRAMPDVDSVPDASTAVNTLISVCRFTDVYADDCRGTGQEAAEIPGAEAAVQADFTYTSANDEPVIGRIWVAVDSSNDVVSAVEYAGVGVDEAELEAFGESIEFHPDQAG
ncbi:hypothetical protein [Nesterenkonia sp.]|uniref:LptM family lipoprotein n=1 Tax=Nesterenkonia sp. TaxID=704201 RepID=UPI002604BBCC|nr:hypothetical protein [Nesterenkonia sp.]